MFSETYNVYNERSIKIYLFSSIALTGMKLVLGQSFCHFRTSNFREVEAAGQVGERLRVLGAVHGVLQRGGNTGGHRRRRRQTCFRFQIKSVFSGI